MDRSTVLDPDFDAYWKETKPAECDEVKEYFVECWQRARAVQREKDAHEAEIWDSEPLSGQSIAAAIRSQEI